LPKTSDSGLVQALRILEKVSGISIVELDETDIVRHRLVKEIVKAFDRHTH
jgi:phosphate starvation-inducible PhoH-like protein